MEFSESVEIILLLWISDDSVDFIRDSTLTALQSCVGDSEGNSVDEAISKAVIDDFSSGLGLYIFFQKVANFNTYFRIDK